jgi:hypothetical protein
MELAESVQVAATAAKDTVQDVRYTTKELRNSHVAAEAGTNFIISRRNSSFSKTDGRTGAKVCS